MIVLGIDPALGSLGWAVVARQSTKLKYLASGTIKTSSKDEIHHRLAFINSTLEKVILEYKPDMAAIEETFVNTNSVTSLKLGYARGAIMSLIGRYNLDMREFKPNTIKKTVTGYGHAEKDQILHMIKLLLPGTSLITNSDEADAVAIAYTCHVMNASLV